MGNVVTGEEPPGTAFKLICDWLTRIACPKTTPELTAHKAAITPHRNERRITPPEELSMNLGSLYRKGASDKRQKGVLMLWTASRSKAVASGWWQWLVFGPVWSDLLL